VVHTDLPLSSTDEAESQLDPLYVMLGEGGQYDTRRSYLRSSTAISYRRLYNRDLGRGQELSDHTTVHVDDKLDLFLRSAKPCQQAARMRTPWSS